MTSTNEKIQALQDKLSVLEQERNNLFELRRPIDEKIQVNYSALEDIKTQLGELKVAEMKEENFIPSYGNWFSEKELELVLLGETNSMPMYRHADRLMCERFNYAFKRHGYVPEHNQTLFSIALVKGDKARTKLVTDVIRYMLPHLKWRTKDGYDRDVEPYILFDIFEHNLSAGGRSCDLIVKNTDKWYIKESRWNETEYPSLEAAMEYIENNLWYERLDKNGKTTSSYDEEEDNDDY